MERVVIGGRWKPRWVSGEGLPGEVDPERIRGKLLDAGWPAVSLR